MDGDHEGSSVTLTCANCRAEGRPAFTLAAYPAGEGDAVLVDFCSSECLEAWTASRDGDGDVPEWTPGEEGVREPSSAAAH